MLYSDLRKAEISTGTKNRWAAAGAINSLPANTRSEISMAVPHELIPLPSDGGNLPLTL